jgi:hypothetical protein
MQLAQLSTIGISGVSPLPLGSIGIIELAENRQMIYGAQSLAGKILMPKNLRSQQWGQIPTMGTNATLRTVSASTMITDGESAAQGQMSQGDVEKG